jgi:nucleotidyltransferase substrate binding protein (TIGR01987 family)
MSEDRSDRRFELAVESFEKALARLHEALDLDESPIVRDALIQRFEFTFEMAWKAMYRWLRARDAAVNEEAFAVLPAAFRNRLVTNEPAWSDIRRNRNLTSHTYREDMAIQVAAFVRAVAVEQFDTLLATLKARAAE